LRARATTKRLIGCHPVRIDLDVDTQPLSRRAVDAYRSPGLLRLHHAGGYWFFRGSQRLHCVIVAAVVRR